MQRTKRWERAQSTAEYAIVIALVLGALVGMQTYVRRAINARIADASDDVLPATQLGAQPGTTPLRYQFEPNYQDSDFTTTSQVGSAANQSVAAQVTMAAGANGISDVTGNYGSRTDRSGTQTETGAP